MPAACAFVTATFSFLLLLKKRDYKPPSFSPAVLEKFNRSKSNQ